MRDDEKVLERHSLPAMRFTAKRVALYAAVLVSALTLFSAFSGHNLLFPAGYSLGIVSQSHAHSAVLSR